MTPWLHAESSARRWGGAPEAYMPLHEWFDSTKQYTGDWTHRALRHHAAGVQEAVTVFGDSLTNSHGNKVPVKALAEQHVTEDCGFIPTVQDWLTPLKRSPSPWMLKVKITSKSSL